MEKNILCVNNRDARQRYLAKLFIEDGKEIVLCEKFCPRMGDYDIVLLPVVPKEVDFTVISEQLRKGQKVFGGNLPEHFINACKNQKVACYDYMKEETIAVKNAVATAEGAVAEAINLSDENLHSSNALVIGYGRCGRILADKLQGMNSHVTILEENEEKRAVAQSYGFSTIKNVEDISNGAYTYVFNTVPEKILQKEQLKELQKNVVIIDIASGEGGVDYDYCKTHGIRAKLCLGLPGKYAPKSSAEILYKYVKQICNEKERL